MWHERRWAPVFLLIAIVHFEAHATSFLGLGPAPDRSQARRCIAEYLPPMGCTSRRSPTGGSRRAGYFSHMLLCCGCRGFLESAFPDGEEAHASCNDSGRTRASVDRVIEKIGCYAGSQSALNYCGNDEPVSPPACR